MLVEATFLFSQMTTLLVQDVLEGNVDGCHYWCGRSHFYRCLIHLAMNLIIENPRVYSTFYVNEFVLHPLRLRHLFLRHFYPHYCTGTVPGTWTGTVTGTLVVFLLVSEGGPHGFVGCLIVLLKL